jgi:hypothetical protein
MNDQTIALEEISKILQKQREEIERPKKEFFEQFFPDIKDPDDWLVLFPSKIELPAGSPDWMIRSDHIPQITAWNPNFLFFDGI